MTGALAALGGALNPTLQLIASSYSDSMEGGGTAEAYFSLANTGLAGGGPILNSGDDSYPWLQDGAASGYDVMATLTTGTFSTGNAAIWENLGTNRSWTASKTGAGTKTCTATFDIRPAGGGATIVSASIQLTAVVTP